MVVPRPTQPSIPPGSANEDQLQLGRQRQVWFIPFVDKRVDVQVKLCDPLKTRAVPERLGNGVGAQRRANALYQVSYLTLYTVYTLDGLKTIAARTHEPLSSKKSNA